MQFTSKKFNAILTLIIASLVFVTYGQEVEISADNMMTQGISINSTGMSPDSSAILDIGSNNKGFLLPRLNSLERLDIQMPATGLLVFDTDLQSLFYFNGAQWVEFASSRKGLRDSDFDTQVIVERGADDDTIRLVTQGIDKLKISKNGLIYESANKNMYVGSGGAEQGMHNMVLGHDAGPNVTTGDSNVYIGHFTAQDFSGAPHSANTVIGTQAGAGILRGDRNVLLGYQATAAAQGYENISIGFAAGTNAFSGSENIFIGKMAGHTSGGGLNNNIAIGTNAGTLDQSGSNSIFIGKNAGSAEVGCDGCIMIGSNVGLNNGNYLNDLLVIDNEVTNKPLIIGRFDTDLIGFNGRVSINSNVPSSELEVVHANNSADAGLTIRNKDNANYWRFYVRSSNGNLRLYSSAGAASNSCGNNGGTDEYVAWIDDCSGAWNSTSDRRKKKNIEDLPASLSSVLALEVVDYQFKTEDDQAKKHIGLIAQDVKKYFPQAVHYDPESDLYTMNYDAFGPLAIKAIQELHQEKEALSTRIKRLEDSLEILMKKRLD